MLYTLRGINSPYFNSIIAVANAFAHGNATPPPGWNVSGLHRIVLVLLNGTIESIIRQNLTPLHAIGENATGILVWHYVIPPDTARVQAWFLNFAQYNQGGNTQRYYRQSQGGDGDLEMLGVLTIIENPIGQPVRVLLSEYILPNVNL